MGGDIGMVESRIKQKGLEWIVNVCVKKEKHNYLCDESRTQDVLVGFRGRTTF